MPDSLKNRLAFHFHLRFSNSPNTNGQNTDDATDFQGVKLERYVLHTVQDDLVSFNIHVPQDGDYFIEVFASLVVRIIYHLLSFLLITIFIPIIEDFLWVKIQITEKVLWVTIFEKVLFQWISQKSKCKLVIFEDYLREIKVTLIPCSISKKMLIVLSFWI